MTHVPQNFKILAVDDNRVTRTIVQNALDNAGYNVMMADSGEAALAAIHKFGLPHLAVVDLNMPGMSGFELCDKVLEFSDLPIIMLTAVDDEETVIRGIDYYAEDYMVKPFNPSELISRIGRILRRIGSFSYTLDPTVIIDDHLQINFPERIATVAGTEIPLTPTESKLLYILMRNAGHTVTTSFLLKRIWPMDEAFEDRLHAHIYRLRRKVEINPKSPNYIMSQWGTGYMFPLPKESKIGAMY